MHRKRVHTELITGWITLEGAKTGEERIEGASSVPMEAWLLRKDVCMYVCNVLRWVSGGERVIE